MWNFPRFSTRVSETTRKPDSVLETLVHNRRPSNHYTHCIHNPQNSQRYRILWWTRASFPLYLCFALGLPRLESRGVTVSGNGSKRLFKKHVSRVIAHSTHWLQNRAFLLLSRLPRRTKKKKKKENEQTKIEAYSQIERIRWFSRSLRLIFPGRHFQNPVQQFQRISDLTWTLTLILLMPLVISSALAKRS